MTKVQILKPFNYGGVEYAPENSVLPDGSLAPKWVEIDTPGLVDWGLGRGALRRADDPVQAPVEPVIVDATEAEVPSAPRTRIKSGGNG